MEGGREGGREEGEGGRERETRGKGEGGGNWNGGSVFCCHIVMPCDLSPAGALC